MTRTCKRGHVHEIGVCKACQTMKRHPLHEAMSAADSLRAKACAWSTWANGKLSERDDGVDMDRVE